MLMGLLSGERSVAHYTGGSRIFIIRLGLFSAAVDCARESPGQVDFRSVRRATDCVGDFYCVH